MSIDRRQFLTVTGGAAAALAWGGGPTEAAAPFKILKRFLIPRMITSKTDKVVLAARPNGGFAALYETKSSSTSYTPSYVRYYGPDTVSEGPTVALARTTYSARKIGAIVMNPDGSSNVFFEGWYGDSYDLWWMQKLSPTGRAVGKPVKIGTGTSGDYHLAVKLAGGNIMAAWRGYSGAVATVVTPDGKRVAINDGGVCDGSLEDVAALSNGGAVVSFYNTGTYKASFQRLGPTGRRVGGPMDVPSIYSAGGMALAAHPRGFVGIWKNSDANDNPIVQGAIYSPTGAKLVTLSTFKLRPAGSEDKYRYFYGVIHCLADGRILVAYDSVRRPDPNGSEAYYEIIGLLFAPTGKLVGRQTLLSVKAGSGWPPLTRPRSLVQLTDGRFLLGYDGGTEFGIEEARGIIFQLA